MTPESLDGVVIKQVRVAVLRTDDNRLEGRIVTTFGGQFGRHMRDSIVVTQGQEERHAALDMRLQSDIALDEIGRCGLVARCGGLPFAAEMLFHGMAHGGRLLGGLGFGLKPEPSLAARSVADVLHASNVTLTPRHARSYRRGSPAWRR